MGTFGTKPPRRVPYPRPLGGLPKVRAESQGQGAHARSPFTAGARIALQERPHGPFRRRLGPPQSCWASASDRRGRRQLPTLCRGGRSSASSAQSRASPFCSHGSTRGVNDRDRRETYARVMIALVTATARHQVRRHRTRLAQGQGAADTRVLRDRRPPVTPHLDGANRAGPRLYEA